MIQFNLLPDVKKEYIKAKRAKRLITSVSFLVTAGFIGLTVLLFLFVRFAQTKNIDDLTDDIESTTSEIQSTENLETMLTVQNQLDVLPELHEGRPETSRVFEMVKFYSTNSTEIRELNINIVDGQIEVSGTIDTLASANKLVDNIKAVVYATQSPDDAEPESKDFMPAYEIVSSNVSRDEEAANFEVVMEVEKDIFDNTKSVIMRLEADQIVLEAVNQTPVNEGEDN